MRRIYSRVIVPIAMLLVANVALSAWLMWRELDQNVASSLHTYASGLNQALAAVLRDSMQKEDRAGLSKMIFEFGRLDWVREAQVLDKKGQVVFASEKANVGKTVPRVSETCRSCHRAASESRNRMTMRRKLGDGTSVLRTAETIRADQTCTECHEVPSGTVLGVLLIDLEMEPLFHSAGRQTWRRFALLVVGSALMLVILLFVIRRVVVGRLRGVSDALMALRMGRSVSQEAEGLDDEIGDLKRTIAALSADLLGRRLASGLAQHLERELCGQRFSVIVADGDGEILLANDEAQRAQGVSYGELAGGSYRALDAVRADLWAQMDAAPLALWAGEATSGAPGSQFVLMKLVGDEDKPVAFLEVGRARPPAPNGESDAEGESGEGGPVFPREFMLSPYRAVGREGDLFFRGLLLLARLSPENLRNDGIIPLDATVARAGRLYERICRSKQVIDDQIDVCDMAQAVRNATADFRICATNVGKWTVLLPDTAPLVAHPVFVRQFAILLLDMAVRPGASNAVVFLERQQTEPSCFVGVWTDNDRAAPPDSARWAACSEIARQCHGELDLDLSYDIEELAQIHADRVRGLGRGVLFLAKFPTILG